MSFKLSPDKNNKDSKSMNKLGRFHATLKVNLPNPISAKQMTGDVCPHIM